MRAVRGYLQYVHDEARVRFDNGMNGADAARDIELGPYADWLDSERIAVNVDSLYREFRNDSQVTDTMELFTQMAALAGFK